MLHVWVHGCDPGRVSDGSRLALCQTLSTESPSSIFFWHVCYFAIFVPFSCRFYVFILLLLELGRCSSDLFLSSRPRTGLATTYISRARSLRNLLVSGNECGRVFPAGVGPGSPSRDAANWLPSRFSLSVETRRRYGWLRMMVFPGARLFPSPNLVPFGRVAARERQGALSRRAW